MTAGDSTSWLKRTQYRLTRLARRIRQKVLPTPTSPAPEPPLSSQADFGEPRLFTETSFGSGAYGQWVLDENGLPAYRYTLNQFEAHAAQYPVSEGAFRRDHWHQVGNERITALASNDGTVQVFIADRGAVFLNQFNHGDRISWAGAAWEVLTILLLAAPRAMKNIAMPGSEPGVMRRLLTAIKAPGSHGRDDQQYAYAGGFGYVDDGEGIWPTAYRYAPALRGQMGRVFGMGYYQTTVQNRDLQVKRTVYAPAGNVPGLLADVELTNTGTTALTVKYYEYWDVNVQQLPFQSFRSGVFGSVGDAERRKLNRDFTSCIVWDAASNALRFHLQSPDGAPAFDLAHEIDWLPSDIFLADLSGTPDAIYTDKAAFFGAGGAENPNAADQPRIRRITDTIMPYCMVLRRTVHLEPGQTAKLRFAYGTVPGDSALNCAQDYPDGSSPAAMPESWRESFGDLYRLDNASHDPFAEMIAYWKQNLAYFTIGTAPHLQREMAWHAYYLLSSTVNHTYFKTRVVPQGSAYLFLHGLDGVPRDFSLYVLPLIYLNAGLARDVLKLIMAMTVSDTAQMAYAYTGFGVLTGATVHNTPSDLDLFFLLAMAEYLAATGDSGFLSEDVPFYPGLDQPDDRSVLNHIRLAFNHLLHEVGIGDSDLIRVLDGDWSDDVVLKNVFPFAPLTSPSLTIEHGESILNTQMALYILPRIAGVLSMVRLPAAQTLGRQMQEEIQTVLPRMEQGVLKHWNGRFYARAVLRYWWNGKRVLRPNSLDLEGQVWALISEFEPKPGMQEQLKDAIYKTCDESSPIGAVLSSGMVWPAVSQLLTWGYTRRYPELAWRSFINHTFATKAEVYPHTWMNIWSGPDGINGPSNSEPGGTYETSPVTPMTDFPTMNNNQHALALLALLRVCGVEPTDDGLRIAPQIPDRYALDLPLLRLDVTPERIRGEYRAHNAGTVVLQVRLSARPVCVQVMLDGKSTPMTPDATGFVRVVLPAFNSGDVIAFEVSV